MPAKLTISDMLNKVRDKKWVLPNFQREFVWTADQIAYLFDSISRGYPIGAIILLKYRKEYLFQARGLDGEEGAGQKHEFYIIDGQQRLTSLYKIICEYPNNSVDDELHYLSIKKEQGAEQKFAFFFKYNAKPREDLYVYAKRINKNTIPEEWIKKNGYIPLEYVFSKGQTLNSYLKKHKIETYKKKITKFKVNINGYEPTVKQCEDKWIINDYRNVFERLNKAGTNLSPFDECASILSKHKFNLHKKWRDVSGNQKFGAIGKLDIDPMYILKTLFIIHQIDHIDHNDPTIQSPSLRNLKRYFKESNLDEINSTWNESVICINFACNQLINEYGVLHKRLIPYTPMIVTLASTWYSFKRFSKKIRFIKTFNKKIDWWYWSSIFSSQYDKSTDNKIKGHVEKLVKWTHPTKAINSKWEKHKIDLKVLRSDLIRMHNNTDARYKGILCLPIAISKLKKDILGKPIVNFEDHHIFPKTPLNNLKLGLSDGQINNIANRIILDIESNRSIKDIFPFQYKKNKILVSKKDWETYIVPSKVNDMEVKKSSYRSFLKERTDLIIEVITKVIKKP